MDDDGRRQRAQRMTNHGLFGDMARASLLRDFPLSWSFKMAAINADKEFLMRRSMTKGYQLFSLLAPPCYIAWVLVGRQGRNSLSLNRVLRATWVGGALGEVMSRAARLCSNMSLKALPKEVALNF
jgi:hypothetical protein